MNIPDEDLWEVFQTVYEPDSRFPVEWAQDHEPDTIDGLRAVAEWARKEALREAAEVIENLPGSDATGYYASEQHSGYQDAQNDAERAIRALAEGGGQ